MSGPRTALTRAAGWPVSGLPRAAVFGDAPQVKRSRFSLAGLAGVDEEDEPAPNLLPPEAGAL
jgi:hypothetical protein